MGTFQHQVFASPASDSAAGTPIAPRSALPAAVWRANQIGSIGTAAHTSGFPVLDAELPGEDPVAQPLRLPDVVVVGGQQERVGGGRPGGPQEDLAGGHDAQ